MKKKTTRITDALPAEKKPFKMVNIKCDPDLYMKLKEKLKKRKTTVKDFLETSAKIFLNEK